MKKFLISVLICFLLICSFGCGENAVSRKIEELQTKIDGQTEAIAELKDQNQRLAEQNKDITTRLTEIEWDTKLLTVRLWILSLTTSFGEKE